MGLAKAKKIELLGGLPLFERCTKRELGEVAGLSVDAEMPAGAVLTREGAKGDLAFVLVSGSARATRRGRTLGVLGAGSIVGELSLIDGGPRTATVTAVEDLRVLELNGDDFRRLLAHSSRFTANLLRAIAGRLRDADAHADMGA
jgi:CRP/FNR family cyclic AMP-dependent transcriptional regulator